MNDAPWELLYDLAQHDSARTIDLVWALVVLVATAVLWWWPRARIARFASVLGLVLLGVLGLRAWEQHQLLQALRDGRTLSAQGPVQGHATEQRRWKRSGESGWRRMTVEAFSVGAVRFGFSRDADAPGFRNLAEPPWAPVAGEELRVQYVESADDDPMGRRILRLERRLP